MIKQTKDLPNHVHFLFPSLCTPSKPIGWCCPHPGWALPLSSLAYMSIIHRHTQNLLHWFVGCAYPSQVDTSYRGTYTWYLACSVPIFKAHTLHCGVCGLRMQVCMAPCCGCEIICWEYWDLQLTQRTSSLTLPLRGQAPLFLQGPQ